MYDQREYTVERAPLGRRVQVQFSALAVREIYFDLKPA